MNKILQICLACGSRSNDHVQGTECPLCCPTCAGEVDVDTGQCLDCAAIRPLTDAQIEVGKFYTVREWDDSQNRVTLTDKDMHTVTIEYDDGTANRVHIDYFRHELRATVLVLTN